MTVVAGTLVSFVIHVRQAGIEGQKPAITTSKGSHVLVSSSRVELHTGQPILAGVLRKKGKRE